MADLASLKVTGETQIDQRSSNPKGVARLQDLHWTDTKPASLTATGVKGQYHSDGRNVYVCYDTNKWGWFPLMIDGMPDDA